MERSPKQTPEQLNPLEKLHAEYGIADAPSLVTYVLYDREGKQIPCHICGEADRWTVEREGIVFVCEHEPVSVASRGAIRQVSTVRANRVAAYEFVGLKKTLPMTGASPWMGGVGI